MIPEALSAAVRDACAARPRPIVLIDGGAGAGKTTLARELVASWPGAAGVELLSLDDLYPGWGGLAAGAAAVPSAVREHGYRSWDWANSRPGAWRRLDAARGLIVEGCGALTRANAALADVRVWLELDAAGRRDRALARDGELFAAHWDEWAAQEERHWAADHPRELADLVLTLG